MTFGTVTENDFHVDVCLACGYAITSGHCSFLCYFNGTRPSGSVMRRFYRRTGTLVREERLVYCLTDELAKERKS